MRRGSDGAVRLSPGGARSFASKRKRGRGAVRLSPGGVQYDCGFGSAKVSAKARSPKQQAEEYGP